MPVITNFSKEIGGMSFRFNTISATTLQVFQVYTPRGGKEFRFHMQRKGEVFSITDLSVCPPEILALEAELSGAILTSQD